MKIEFEFPDLAKLIEENRQRIYLFMAANMQTNRGMMFDAEGAYNGHPKWKPLSFRNGQILKQRGTLSKSIGPMAGDTPKMNDGSIVRVEDDVVTIGTELGYAAMMNDGTTKLPGGKLTAKNAKALKIPLPQGAKAGEGAKSIQKAAIQKSINEITQKMNKAKSGQSKARYMERINKLKAKQSKGSGPVKFIFRKSVTIPARPFDQWNSEDERELAQALQNYLLSKVFR